MEKLKWTKIRGTDDCEEVKYKKWTFILYRVKWGVIGYKVIVKNKSLDATTDIELNYNFLTKDGAKKAVKRFINNNLK